MLSLLVETFRPWLIAAILLVRCFCIAAGLFLLLLACSIHSGLGAAESLVFFVPAVLLTWLRRPARGVPR